jgi:hypothetical protein
MSLETCDSISDSSNFLPLGAARRQGPPTTAERQCGARKPEHRVDAVA